MEYGIRRYLNFKEILCLKYASIIGTLFDMKMLNKINPLNNIIKDEDIFKLVEKLNENYFIELHNEIQQKNSVYPVVDTVIRNEINNPSSFLWDLEIERERNI